MPKIQHYQLATLSSNMKNINKIILGLVCVCILGIAVYLVKSPTQDVAGSSPVGSSFSTAKFYGVTVNLATPGVYGTSTSILNTDSQDRYVSALKVGCQGVGQSKTPYTGAGNVNLQIIAGTTTTAAPATSTLAQSLAMNFTIATGLPTAFVSSSTLQTATSTNATVWAANTYMTFFFTATNTAVCTVGVDAFGS